MNTFKQTFLDTRRVSVWGIGYLGYTSLLMLQSKGFYADVFDFDSSRLYGLAEKEYPNLEHKTAWSSRGELPSLDLTRINIVFDLENMFDNSVHIISFPGKDESDPENKLAIMAEYFIRFKERLKDCLILFQAAETPGDIEKYFITPLKQADINCSFASLFRTDWSAEEFFQAKHQQITAGHDRESMKKLELILCMLGIRHTPLPNIKSAEIYENSRKVLNHLIASFINQLSLAYSDVDIRRMVVPLVQSIRPDEITSGMGPIGYKYVAAVDSILEGSLYPERLRMVRDSETSSLSAILNYADFLKRKSIVDVTILGICEKGDQKDIRLSGPLVLAEKLVSDNICVRLHDPYFTEEEIMDILPGVGYTDLSQTDFKTECIILMTDHRMYRYFTQPDLDRITRHTRLIIDNPGMWEKFTFPSPLIYHIPGDGNLERLG